MTPYDRRVDPPAGAAATVVQATTRHEHPRLTVAREEFSHSQQCAPLPISMAAQRNLGAIPAGSEAARGGRGQSEPLHEQRLCVLVRSLILPPGTLVEMQCEWLQG